MGLMGELSIELSIELEGEKASTISPDAARGKGAHALPPRTATPHVSGAAAKANIPRKFAGNARIAASALGSQKHGPSARASSRASRSQQASASRSFRGRSSRRALARSAPAHPSCTSRSRVAASHATRDGVPASEPAGPSDGAAGLGAAGSDAAGAARATGAGVSTSGCENGGRNGGGLRVSSDTDEAHSSPTRGFTPHDDCAAASGGTSARCASPERLAMDSPQKHRASFSAASSAQQNASRPGAVSLGSHSRGRRSSRSAAHGASAACALADTPSAATSATRSADDLGACRVISPARPSGGSGPEGVEEAEETRERATETHEDARGSLLVRNRNAVRVHAKWHAGFDLFFSRLSFRRFAKKNLQRSPIPALFGSATVRRPFRV